MIIGDGDHGVVIVVTTTAQAVLTIRVAHGLDAWQALKLRHPHHVPWHKNIILRNISKLLLFLLYNSPRVYLMIELRYRASVVPVLYVDHARIIPIKSIKF